MKAMDLMNRVFRMILTANLTAFGVASCCHCQTPTELNVLGAPVSQHTAVRLFFDNGNYFHPPLIFRVAASNDPRLKTAPMLPEGRIAFVTMSEMERLLRGLHGMGLSWKESKEQTLFGDATKILPVFDGMSIVVSSKGTAESGIHPAKICENLALLDSSLSTPRALWEFQIFRAEYNCKVSGLNGQAYPDHWPWNK
jgi:hypothetical protein